LLLPDVICSFKVAPATESHNTVFTVFLAGELGRIVVVGEFMRADIYIDKTQGGSVEISVVRDGLSSGVDRRYDTVEKARSVLVKFGLDPILIDHHLRSLTRVPPSFLLRFPAAEIADDILRSLGFRAAAFHAG